MYSEEKNKNNSSFDSFSFQELDLKVTVILPAYNEEKTIFNVIKELIGMGLNIVVIDDGSKDNTNHIAHEMKKKKPEMIHIYRHRLNRGLGATLKTGIEAALFEKSDIMVTFDADGQHNPKDIIKVVKPIIEEKVDVVIGKRDFNEMPLGKKLGNNIMNILTMLFYGISVKDSQSGLRAFNRKTAELMILHSRDYGISSEIIGEIGRNNLKMVEIPITTIYTDYSRSKGTNTKVGLKILAKLIRNVLK